MKVTEQFVFFWGKKDIFSQWHDSPFSDKGLIFKTAEHYMMFQKAVFFEYKNKSIEDIQRIIQTGQEKVESTGIPSRNILVRILTAPTPKAAKALGREVRFFNKEEWESIVAKVLFKGNQLKFEQNPALYQTLMQYRTQRFVEASPFDKIYGIGMKESHPNASNPACWLGENILGDTLTELRNYFLRNNKL